MTWLCWSGLGYADGFAVDRFHNSFPARQSFLEAEFDACDKVIALASEGWVWYLSMMLVLGLVCDFKGINIPLSRSGARPGDRLLPGRPRSCT